MDLIASFPCYSLELDDFELPSKTPPADEKDFFHKIEEAAEKIIIKEQRQEHYKSIDVSPFCFLNLNLNIIVNCLIIK